MVHEGARVQKGSASMRLQRCFAIKSGVNGLLDVARRIYCEIVDDIEDMVAAMAEDTGMATGDFIFLPFRTILERFLRICSVKQPACEYLSMKRARV